MKKWGVLFALIAYYFHLFGVSNWQVPNNQLRYHEVCFLTSHNSYAAKNHGYYYAQQRWSIEDQLKGGIRGLMLDTHLNTLDNEILLCHGNISIDKIIRGGKPPLKLAHALQTIATFLINNPHEIVTIFLENYVRQKELIDGTIKAAGLEHTILSPSCWNPATQGWPTIEWMQKNNKRLVIFNSIEETELTFHVWEHVVENQFGTLNPVLASKERKESRSYRSSTRYLYLINYFPRLKINFGRGYELVNSIQLNRFLEHLKKGLSDGYCKQRLPNFIGLDFVDEGHGMERVNTINRQTTVAHVRSLLFRPL